MKLKSMRALSRLRWRNSCSRSVKVSSNPDVFIPGDGDNIRRVHRHHLGRTALDAMNALAGHGRAEANSGTFCTASSRM